MKFTLKSIFVAIISFASMAISFAATSPLQRPDELSQEKIATIIQNETLELRKSVDEKQLRAIKLINAIGSKVNDSLSTNTQKDDAGSSYGAFITRFQIIHDEREILDTKETPSDYKTLQNYSQRLDRLIDDINKY